MFRVAIEAFIKDLVIAGFTGLFSMFKKDPASETIKEIRNEDKEFNEPVPDKKTVIDNLP